MPEVRSRVSLRVTAKLVGFSPAETAQAEATLLPRWDADRLAEALRTREIGVVDGTGLVAPALGKTTFSEVVPTDPLGVERFLGDLLICRFPQFSLASEGVVAALSQQLLQGRSVIWLTDGNESRPPILHSGPAYRFRHFPTLRSSGLRELPRPGTDFGREDAARGSRQP